MKRLLTIESVIYYGVSVCIFIRNAERTDEDAFESQIIFENCLAKTQTIDTQLKLKKLK